MKKLFSIGGLKITLEVDSGDYKIILDKALEAFVAGPFDVPDIRFQVDTTSPFPNLDLCREIFTSNPEGLWTVLEYKDKTGYFIALQSDVVRKIKPYKIIRADRKFADFIIYTRPDDEGIIFPMEYPFADLAVSGHININRIGMVLHSACLTLGGRGYLFAGVSGSGKSTISELWQQDQDAEVLTDERVIIREFQSDLCAFGTPWHGTSDAHKNIGAPIEKIFFIKHGKENKVSPISKTEAANRLMVRCFPTFWNREGMEFALEFCSLLAQRKDCYDFQFVPDQSAINFIKKLVVGKQLS